MSYRFTRWMALIALLVIGAQILTACGGAATTAAPAATEAPAAKFKMAVILTGPPDDNSWNEAGYNAIQAMEAQGVEIAYSESVSDADVARVE
ncbi:MAG: hypothetical protein AABZ58_06495, partial [Chloroflexota bacterium]